MTVPPRRIRGLLALLDRAGPWRRNGPPVHRTFAAILLLALAPAAAGATAPPTPRMLLLDAARAGSALVAVGERGTILRSTDEAQSWQPAKSPTRAALTAIAFASTGRASARVGWIVGHDALILGSADGGATWLRQFQGDNLQDSFLDVIALDERRVIAVGAYGLFLATSDAGRTWQRRKPIEDDFHFNRISRGPSGTLYLAGESGTLLRSADDGASWTALSPPYEGSFYGVLPLGERTLLAYGLRGHVYRSEDDGATWRAIPTPQPVLLATAARTKDNVLLLAGQSRTLLLSRDAGVTFAAVEPPASAIAELLPLENGALLAVGDAGITLLAAP